MFGCSDDYHWMRFGTYLSTVNRLRPRHLAPRQWILARITARNAQHSPLTAAAKSHLVGFKNSFPLSISNTARAPDYLLPGGLPIAPHTTAG